MSISQNFPDEGPTLSLNFASSKTLDPRITFIRASTGTYFDDNGQLVTAPANAPRFNHNPTTGESLGLLVEEARTNLVTWSQDLSNADWAKASSTIVSTAVASPIQGVNYQKIEATSANTAVGVTSIAVTATTQQRAVSFFAQPLGNISRVLVVIQGADARININLVDGTFTTNAAATGSTVSVSGQRFSISTPTLTLATGVRFFLKRTGGTDTDTPTTIAIGEGLYLTGAQMEAGAFPTSYIPTTTSTATRAADVASITGTNFSSWYDQTEGTVFGEYFPSAVAPATNSQTVIIISNNTNTDRNIIHKRANADQSTRWASVKTGATNTAFINAGTWLAANTKIAAVYKNNDYAASLNGAASITDTTVDLFTGMTQINIGSDNTGSSILNGTIKRLTYWPTRLSNTTLQTLTK
jgi:hypothetical protein